MIFILQRRNDYLKVVVTVGIWWLTSLLIRIRTGPHKQHIFPDGIELRSHIVHWVVCLTLLFWDERGRFSKILDVGYWGWRGGPLNRNGSHNISETNFATHEQNLFFVTWIILYRLDWTMCIKHDYAQDTINRRAHTLCYYRDFSTFLCIVVCVVWTVLIILRWGHMW